MKRFHLLACAGAVTLLAVLTPRSSLAQQLHHGSTEISMMHGFVLVSSGDYNDDKAVIIMTPVPPVWRLTIWTQSPLTLDLGFSLLSASSGGDNATFLNLEGGVGANLGARDAKTVPFVGVVGGIVSLSASHEESETDPYFGGQFGGRTFFRDYAAVRVQLGLRHVFTKGGDGVNLFEAVAGLSFFL